MRIEHISLLHLLHATFGSINEENVTIQDKSSLPSDVLPTRQTTHGEILGYYMEFNGTLAEVYEAVPYAQPPIGSLRFEATQSLIGWNETRNCGKGQMVRCVQFGQNANEGNGTEDCLYATIVIPYKKMRRNVRYPIVIWLHGGSFQTGSASATPIESIVENFASENIIFVAINYRLGPLGFLTANHRDLHGNYGLDDQIEAIRWIRANARNFDGNLNNIVVGGMGAGAACASILAVSSKARGKFVQSFFWNGSIWLFNGVILRSGSSIAPWAVRSVSTENYSAHLIDYCGCGYNRTLGMLHTIECLKTIPVGKLQKAWKYIAKLAATVIDNENFHMGSTYFTPTTDPYRIEASVLPGDPMSILLQNPRMPLLIGVTNGEVAQMRNTYTSISNRYLENGEWDLSYVIPPYLHANYKQVQKAVEYQYLTDYPQNLNEAERRNVILSILSDQHFIAPAAREALLYSRKNRTVYAYIFEYENTQLLGSVRKIGIHRGASHGNDCSFLFNNPSLSNSSLKTIEWNDKDREISRQLVSQMANFIRRRNLSEDGFERFTTIYRAATPINNRNANAPVEFFSNVTVFWHEVIPAIEQLHIAPQYRVLLQPCTMCQYPYKIPFYIILIVLILITIGLLTVCVHRQQRVRQKPTYAIVQELKALKSDEKLKVELKMP
uniref:COesterase domain-containing protein n=1 Tax=Elaeophora elaphi TaxID=1147741 RepID=A0A0R3RZB1_9BILA